MAIKKKTETETKPETQSITLDAPHEHEGILYMPGATLELTPKQVDWLIRGGVAHLAFEGARAARFT